MGYHYEPIIHVGGGVRRGRVRNQGLRTGEEFSSGYRYEPITGRWVKIVIIEEGVRETKVDEM